MTADLVAFLRARLDEDESTARDAIGAPPHPSGYPHGTGIVFGAEKYGVPEAVIGSYLVFGDPARVLAEVDAKRSIIGELPLSPLHDPYDALGELVLAYLALPYRDHPDYRPEWAPER